MTIRDIHFHTELLGMQLRRDMFNKAGVLIVPASTVLNYTKLKILESHGISLEESDVQSATSSVSRTVLKQNVLINESVLQIEEIFGEIRHTKEVSLFDIRNRIIPMIHETTEQPNLYGLFASLQSKDDYTYRHNIGVGVIATIIGRWLGLKETELMELTMAGTLHDVGKVRIPLEILNKPGKLTKEEFALMKKHTIFGYEMIKETPGTNHRLALVALQHHERQNGSGYPFGIRSNKIDSFSRIVAVADVFHAMTSRRSYRKETPFYETLKQMYQDGFGILDTPIIHLFLDKMMQSLIGNQVLLTDGRTGSIIMINRHDPMHPLVKIAEVFLDLSRESSVHIEQVIIEGI
ncbi:HD-GYP domain-containing protein [Paenibacillus sp. FA6]|uniref:HD-GYP domain-containing protein n=1 Tax=Paenibacillus sp. FA6 TaxID=3413029 RepID=UPI003F65E8C0